jgi:hypothetical protein
VSAAAAAVGDRVDLVRSEQPEPEQRHRHPDRDADQHVGRCLDPEVQVGHRNQRHQAGGRPLSRHVHGALPVLGDDRLDGAELRPAQDPADWRHTVPRTVLPEHDRVKDSRPADRRAMEGILRPRSQVQVPRADPQLVLA